MEGYKSPSLGNEISCVMHGISEEILNNNSELENNLIDALKQDGFNILEKASHHYEPRGFTLVVLLAESHASIHTYPEHNSLFFYLYSCRGKGDGRETFEIFKEKIKPTSVDFSQRTIVVKR